MTPTAMLLGPRFYAASPFILAKAFVPYDHVSRYGGEEFLLLANIALDSNDYRLRSLHASLSNLTVSFENKLISLTCSMGACLLRPSDEKTDANLLLSSANDPLYQAKRGGRNRLVQAQDAGRTQAEAYLQTHPNRQIPDPDPR